MVRFDNIKYLENGTLRQQEAYGELVGLGVFEKLAEFSPLLTGTIPIGIDLPESDLDIICECIDHRFFYNLLIDLYGEYQDFEIKSRDYYGVKATVAKFRGKIFEIEIFGQDVPTHEQNAYRHMLIEHRLLVEKGPEFREEIIELKKSGYKTEPAFAKVLGLEGNPYLELLNC